MIRLLTRDAQKALDQYLIARGIPLMLLMEAAGAALADVVLQKLDALGSVDLLAGPGMNGGDLYVAARKLVVRGVKARVWEVEANASLTEGLVFEMRQAALACGVRCEKLGYDVAGDLLVDGLLGAGFQPERALSAELELGLRLLEAGKARGARLIACDLPSGIGADEGFVHPLAVRADATVTFLTPKIGQMMSPACQYNGELICHGLELPARLLEEFWEQYEETGSVSVWSEADSRHSLSAYKSSNHKGDQGYLLVVAGSAGMAGAARLAGEAAQRSGTGIVHLVCDQGVYPEIFQALPSALYSVPESEAEEDWLEAMRRNQAKATAVLLGPGLGRSERTGALVREALSWEQPLVLDADALNLLAEHEDLRALLHDRQSQGRSTVLTPHGGEAARLANGFGLADWQDLSRLGQARALAEATQCLFVLKGEATLVASPDGRVTVNPTGGPALAKGGSGDVLAGLTGGLVAQRLPFRAAVAGAVFWHGGAADVAAVHLGWRSTTPLEVLEYLPSVRDLP